MYEDRHLYQMLLRQDLAGFVEKTFATLEPGKRYLHNWHIEHLCWQLNRVARGEVRRLIINVPPRAGKSITVSVAFTAWMLGRDPAKRIICVSYAEELARKLSVDTRTILESPWFREVFPALRLASRKPRAIELMTTARGYRLAAGMGGSILGRGADLILLDDPIKPMDALSAAERRRVAELMDNTLYTRLDNKQTGAIVIVMQRLHVDDLVGHVQRKDEWEVVSIPAIAEEDQNYQISDKPMHRYHRRAGEVLHEDREPLPVLEAQRRAMGSLLFSAQYQQAPVRPEGNVIKRDWLRSYRTAPPRFDFTIASWDTASTLSATADYSVGTVWGAKGLDFYLLDRVRLRREVPELRREIVRLSRQWDVDQTLIEDTDIGRGIAQDLYRTNELRPLPVRPRLDKQARFLAQSARFEAGQVYVPHDAPWLADWIEELLAFPNGQHDDQVDSTSQALDYLTGRSSALHRSREPRERPPRRPRPAGYRRPSRAEAVT